MLLEQLINNAKANSDEGWAAIDEFLAIQDNANDANLNEWAKDDGIFDDDPYIRDLAVSILEKSTKQLSLSVEKTLKELMQVDPNPYVQYRASFTLFNRGIHNPEVISKMKSALEDPDVKEIAEGYLATLSI